MQVERVVKAGSIDPKLVKIPGILVDAVVVSTPEEHQQCFNKDYDPTLTGEALAPEGAFEPLPLSAKKIIGRRAAMELTENTVVNLGIGAPEYVSAVANEEGIGDYMTLTVEAGPIGRNPHGRHTVWRIQEMPTATLNQTVMFDFYDGGGIDLAFLGLAQADESGNVNVSNSVPGSQAAADLSTSHRTRRKYSSAEHSQPADLRQR